MIIPQSGVCRDEGGLIIEHHIPRHLLVADRRQFGPLQDQVGSDTFPGLQSSLGEWQLQAAWGECAAGEGRGREGMGRGVVERGQ